MSTTYAQLAKRLPLPIYKLAAQMYIDRVYPRHLFIETTANCNLSCAYCPREKNTSHISFELFRKIVDEARRYGPRSFSLHLFGEPLLYPRIFEAIRYIKKSHPRNTVLITTNGTLLNDCIDDFVSSGIDQAFWTWRREARFNESTLLKLKTWGRFRVRFIDEITPPEAYEQWRDWKNVEGRRMHNYGGEIDTGRWLKLTKKSKLKEKSELDLDPKTMIQKPQSMKSQTKTFLDQKKRWPCYHLFLAPAVAWNGKFLMCCADPHQKEILGDVQVETVSEAWQRVETLRNSHLRGEYKGICSSCDIWREYPDLFWEWQKK